MSSSPPTVRWDLVPRSQAGAGLSPLGLFIDRLVQTFEDRRPGIADEAIESGESACERFFLEVYGKESPRLQRLIQDMEHLAPDAREALFTEVDRLIRSVVIPAYLRLTVRFTPKERNDFYVVREGLHALERIGWGVAGMALGAFAVWAPFIPLWSKEWVLPFVITGLLFPNIRRYFAFRRYEKHLNELVARADREAARIDVSYLLSDSTKARPRIEERAAPLPASDSPKTRVH